MPAQSAPDFPQQMRRRNTILRAAQAFFEEDGFIQVDTPVAIVAPAPELYIEAPEVTLATPHGAQRRFLQTSPELPMKRLLARGLDKIFQIAPVFRDGEVSPQHRPEFRMLEWYRNGANWRALLDDCEALLRRCCVAVHGHAHLERPRIDLAPPFRRSTVDEAFIAHAGFSILESLETKTLRGHLVALGIAWSTTDNWNDLFHRVFLDRVEPALLSDPAPLFLTHYPAPLASLAQLSSDDPRTAERFELYVGGMELANGFGELTDANVQRERFLDERSQRSNAGLRDYPMPEAFLQELTGIETAAGIALGWERLLMLLLGAQDIDEVAFIAWSDA